MNLQKTVGKALLLFIMLVLAPMVGHTQDYLSGKFAENRVTEDTHDTIQRTYWQVLERAGIVRKLNAFYRLSRINSDLYLDLKIIEGGDPFVVARNAPLKLVLESGNILVLYNSKYVVSCPGCGARGYGGSAAQGAMLTFRITPDDLHTLLHNYIAKIGINTGDDYLEKNVNQDHNELFMDEVRLIAHKD